MAELRKKNSSFYTQPTDDPKTCPTHKYTLRGVATTPSTCYVLEKTRFEADNDLIELEGREWQWWKLEYVSTDAQPVVTTKVSEKDVLIAARFQSRTVLLVYADEDAVNYESTPLPSQLSNFVRTDNLSFQAELDDYAPVTRESPGKRKAVDDDQDDLITEHGRSPPFNRDHYRDEIEADEGDFAQPSSSHVENMSGSWQETSHLDAPGDVDEDYVPPPAPMSSFRALKPKPTVQGSSDDNIPISLRPTDPILDKYKPITEEGGQEMQERSSKGARAKFMQGRRPYVLGSYVPEMDMEDDDDMDYDDEKPAPPEKD